MMTRNNDKLDLNDVSFLMAVRIDSMERYRNLLLSIKYLCRYTNCHILILEADAEPKISSHLLQGNVEYHFVKDDNDCFHRTHYNNCLAGLAKTAYVCVYDIDVIVPLLQLAQTVELLRQGYSYVLPYDGSLIWADEKQKEAFVVDLDCQVLGNAVDWDYVCGGAIFMNRQDFIHAGMSNEHITSWGQDDTELKKRIEILGYPMAEVKGVIFHLPHPRGENSTYRDADNRKMLTEEYLKVAAMGKVELLQYIETWDWAKSCESCEIPEYDCILRCLEGLAVGGNSVLEGYVGKALLYIYLSKICGNDGLREKGMKQLEAMCISLGSELREGKTNMAWLLGILMQEGTLPKACDELLLRVERWLFGQLKRRGQITANGDDNILFIGWFYYSLLTGICKGHYDFVYYREQVLFVTDRIYELLMAQREKVDSQFLGKVLLLISRLRVLGINWLKVERIYAEAFQQALAYLRGNGGDFRERDGWLLYALWTECLEMQREEREMDLNLWCREYLRQWEGRIVEPRLSWMLQSLNMGKEDARACIPMDSVFGLLVKLNVPLAWLYGWILI